MFEQVLKRALFDSQIIEFFLGCDLRHLKPLELVLISRNDPVIVALNDTVDKLVDFALKRPQFLRQLFFPRLLYRRPVVPDVLQHSTDHGKKLFMGFEFCQEGLKTAFQFVTAN
ncbi:hypothetical protein [Roseovarius sp. MBR-154]